MAKHHFAKGDRVRLIRLDGTLSDEVVVIHDLWGSQDNARNASFWSGNQEQHWHTDLMKAENDTSPVVVPAIQEWFIARGNNMGWGRAKTPEGAVKNMRRQGGTVTAFTVSACNQWTTVDGMGCLSYPAGSAVVELYKSPKAKAKARA